MTPVWNPAWGAAPTGPAVEEYAVAPWRYAPVTITASVLRGAIAARRELGRPLADLPTLLRRAEKAEQRKTTKTAEEAWQRELRALIAEGDAVFAEMQAETGRLLVQSKALRGQGGDDGARAAALAALKLACSDPSPRRRA